MVHNNKLEVAAANGKPRFGDTIRRFVRMESFAGLVLLAATVLAMLLKNSPAADLYQAFLFITAEVRIGPLSVNKPFLLWINDAGMAIFFLLVAMEIKRELIDGYLSDYRQIALPAIAALGGIVVPATIYVLLNLGDPVALHGWAIPTATDIAFALGVLALLGSRVPISLKIFLMTLAIIDDLAGIVMIAFFYTAKLSILSLGLALVGVALLAIMNRLGVMRISAYVLLGIAIWICVLKSGVHATLAGVALGFSIPARSTVPGQEPPMQHLIHSLHPWVAFAILPIFAFMNAGIAFANLEPQLALGSVPMGIFLGLFVGKQLGVFTFAWISIRLGLAQLPAQATWLQLYGVSVLAGIGFTMSLFIGSLAFAEGGAGYALTDRLGILAGSFLSGVVGYLVLRFARPAPAE